MKGLIKAFVFAGLLIFAGWFLTRVNDDLTPFTPKIAKSNMEVSNLRTYREVSGRQWKLLLREATQVGEKQQGTDLTGESDGAYPSRFSAKAGTFQKGVLQLEKPEGLWGAASGNVVWQGSRATWKQSTDLWSLEGDVNLTRNADGARMKAHSPKASWQGREGKLTTEQLRLLCQGTSNYQLNAPVAQWDQSSDRWEFPKGVAFKGDQGEGEGEQGEVVGGREVRLQKGTIRWNEN